MAILYKYRLVFNETYSWSKIRLTSQTRQVHSVGTYNITYCSLTLGLVRVKYWGHSTQLFAYDELTKLTGEFSDLSLYPNWISLRDVLPEAAGRAEASPHW